MKLKKVNKKYGVTYALDYYHQGRRHRLQLNTKNKRLAIQIMHKIQDDIIRDTFHFNSTEKKQMRLSEYFKDYFARVTGTKKESTLKGEQIYTKTLIKVIGDVYLSTIDKRTVEMWRASRLNQIRPTSFNIELRVMKMLFNRAVEDGHVESNPFKFIRQIRSDEQRLYLNENERNKLFDKPKELVIIATNKRRRMIHYNFMLFCEVLIGTGMRRKEALSIEPAHVDFDKNVITIEKIKGKRIREIPMTVRVREIFQELYPGFFKGLSGATVSHKFHEAAVAIGLPKNMKLHSLRHTFATLLIENGYDIKIVKELLGHEDIRITEIYAKVSSKIMRQAVSSLEGKSFYRRDLGIQ